MHIIVGASGQVGSAVAANLVKNGQAVKGIVRNKEKAEPLKKIGADFAIADAFNLTTLTSAFKDGSTLFVITPETGKNEDVIGDTKTILKNYREALKNSSIKKVIGLSSIGAQYNKGTGNLLMSYLLEHAFEGLPVKQTFIRPAYYFSNWMLYLQTVKETGILPTFYPVDMAIPMISPIDVAKITTNIITNESGGNNIHELIGPASYSSADVAEAFSNTLNKSVKAQQIPHDQWAQTLKKTGFSADGAKNFIAMTEVVVAGKTQPEGKNVIKGTTTLQQYIDAAVK